MPRKGKLTENNRRIKESDGFKTNRFLERSARQEFPDGFKDVQNKK